MGSPRLSVVYRAPSQFPLLGVLEHGGFLAQHGIEVGFELITESAPAEKALLQDGADFIFGSHIGPYNRLAEGVPMVCLASTVNVTLESFASRAPISSLAEVQGMRVAGPLLRNEFGDIDHPTANKLLILERAGVADDVFEYLEDDDERGYEVVGRGAADGAFIRTYQRSKAEALGLHVLELPPLMMVNSITLTTTWPTVDARSDEIASLVRALAAAIRFMRERPDHAKQLLHDHVASRLNLQTAEEVDLLYDKEMARLDERLFVHPEAVTNAFFLALKYGDRDLLSTINPMQLWDMRFVHELHRSGFYDTELVLPPQLAG